MLIKISIILNNVYSINYINFFVIIKQLGAKIEFYNYNN
jgi:hypothetical protein